MSLEFDEDDAPRLLLGTWVREKYRLDRIIGSGGMAVVFAATHRNKKRLAVKMLRRSIGAHAEMQRRFLREGYVANTVDHPGAVSVLDDDVAEDGTAFLVMELLDGAPVDSIVTQHGGTLSVKDVLNIAFQTLDTLAAAHAKDVIHRDIKPANLFVTRSGQVKVLDFGIARLRDTSSSRVTTQAGSTFGTPSFMAPEQALGKVSEIDGRTDLWSVGATMLTLLTGREVHLAETAQHMMVLAATQQAPSLVTVLADAPPSLVALIDRALAFDKQERWPGAIQMRDAVAVTYAGLFDAPMRRANLGDLLPPPMSIPDLSGASLVPPPRTSSFNSRDSSGALAATIAEAHPVGASVTDTPVSADPRARRGLRGRRLVGTVLAIALGIVVAATVVSALTKTSGHSPTGAAIGLQAPSSEQAVAASSVGAPEPARPMPPATAITPEGPASATATASTRPRAAQGGHPAVHVGKSPPDLVNKPDRPRPASQGPTDFDTQ